MKTQVFILLMLSLTGILFADILLEEDFSGDTSEWIMVNGSSTNQWVVGNATGNNAPSLYISNDEGDSHSYTYNSAATVWVYREITFPENAVSIQLSFDLHCDGESSWIGAFDYFKVFLFEDSYTPSAGTGHGTQAQDFQIGANYYVGITEWTPQTIMIPTAGNAGETKRLAFMWRNDTMTGSTPAAVDNVLLTYDIPPDYPYAVTLIAPAHNAVWLSSTPSFSWTASAVGATATHFDVYIETAINYVANGFDLTSPISVDSLSYIPSPPLAFDEEYYWMVVPVNDAGDGIASDVRYFTTTPTYFITPSGADFGLVYYGDEASQEFTIHNMGNATLAVNSIVFLSSTAHFAFTDGVPPVAVSLENGETYTFVVKYAPAEADTHSAVIEVMTDDLNNSVKSIEINGQCIDTRIMSFPHLENFDSANVFPHGWQGFISPSTSTSARLEISATNAVSSPHSVRLYNQTSSDVIVLRTPFVADLNTRRVSLSARTLTAGTSLHIGYMTDPADTETFVSIETLSLTSFHTEYIVPLTGALGDYIAIKHGLGGMYRDIYVDNVEIGVLPEGADFVCATENLVFPDFRAGTTSSASLTIGNRNTATAPLTIIDWELPDGVSTTIDFTTVNIAPAGSQTIDFILTTEIEGVYSNEIVIYTNADNMPIFTLPIQSFVVPADIIIIGHGTATADNHAPLNFNFRKSFSQTIYPASALPYSGEITYLSYHLGSSVDNAALLNMGNWIVWMKHCSESDFGSSTAATGWIDYGFPERDWVKVYDYNYDGNVDFSGTGARWIGIELSQSFTYNGIDNLIIAVMRPDGDFASSNNRWSQTSTAPLYSSKIYRTDGTVGVELDTETVLSNTSSVPAQSFANIRLRLTPRDSEEPEFAITPYETFHTFPQVEMPLTDSRTYIISNIGGGSFQVWDISLVGDDVNFALENITNLETELDINTTASFTVRYTPTAPTSVPDNTTVQITLNQNIIGMGYSYIYELSLYGTAVDNSISLPVATNFGTFTHSSPPTLNGKAWTRMNGVLAVDCEVTPYDSYDWGLLANWFTNSWGNIPDYMNDNGVSAVLNLYTNRNGWLVTPWIKTIDYGFAEGVYLTFDVALTDHQEPTFTASGPNQRFAVVVSTDNTWSSDNAVAIWDNVANSGNRVFNDIPTGVDGGLRVRLNLTDYLGQTFKVAFYGGSNDHYSYDLNLFIDNVEIAYGSFVNDEELPIVPQSTMLGGNYPNPFNPSTTISFAVGGADLRSQTSDLRKVTIDIYNVKGQKVRSLVNENYNTGTHKVVWNGTDDNGRSVGSGVYFYRMQTNDYTSTKRMILLK